MPLRGASQIQSSTGHEALAPPRGPSLTTRVMLLVGGLVAGVIAIYATETYRELRGSAVATAGARLDAIGTELLRSGSAGREQMIVALRAAAADPAIRALALESRPGARAAALAHLRATEEPRSQVLLTQLVAIDGREVLSTGRSRSWSDPATSRDVLGELAGTATDSASTWVGRLRAFGDTVTFPLVARIAVDGTTRGAIVQWRRFELRGLDQLSRMLGARTDVYVGNRSGDVWTSVGGRALKPPVDVSQGRGLLSYDRPGVGEVIAVARMLPGTPWTLVVETSRADVLAPAREFLTRLDIIGVGVLAIGLLGALWLSRGFTRPVALLTDAVERVTAGDYAHGTGLPSRSDEIGRLSVAFEAMVVRVREAFAERSASEEKYRRLIRESPDGISLTTLDGRYLVVNPALIEMLGYASEEELLALNAAAVYAGPGDRKALVKKVLEGGRLKREDVQLRRQDGKLIDVQFTGRAVRNTVDGEQYIEGVFEDVTERLQVERQFQQAQKMEAVGRLAGGVAHDFNNLLTVIRSYCDLVLLEMSNTDPRREELGEISRAADRAAALARQLLAFSRKQVMLPRVFDLNEVVRSVESMLTRTLPGEVKPTLRLSPTLGAMKADSGQIEQVLMNLAINAADAMPNGGNLVIETGNATLDALYARQHVGVAPGEYVMVSVSDTGSGMSKETMEHIFEPFFTTKPEGQGTGLGLSTVYGIAKQAGGHVGVYSEPGRGSTFKVYFPLVHEEISAPRRARAGFAAGEGVTGTVLVVEDEPSVRASLTRILERQGYTVLGASHGGEAMRIASQHQGTIDLVISDLTMPEMSGRDFVARYSVARPESRVLFMSGYTDEDVHLRGLVSGRDDFIAKPFTVDEITRKVRDVLARV